MPKHDVILTRTNRFMFQRIHGCAETCIVNIYSGDWVGFGIYGDYYAPGVPSFIVTAVKEQAPTFQSCRGRVINTRVFL